MGAMSTAWSERRSAGVVLGVVGSIFTAAAFDFFHTRPFNTLKITNADDVETTILLLVVGLAAGEVATWAARLRARLHDEREQMRRLQRVAELAAIAEPDSLDALTDHVAAELQTVLRLRDCWFERPPHLGRFPVLDRVGDVEATVSHHRAEGLVLPADGVELPVVGAGRVLGRFVLIPQPRTGVSLERRLVAVTMADQVGAALAWRAAS
jgi:hypothetical protein